MVAKAWRRRLRYWVVEPAVAGYAAAGVVAIHALPEMGLEPSSLTRAGLVLNAIALVVALALSFWRMFLRRLIRQLATTIADGAGDGRG